MKLIQEFKEFAVKGNMIDIAIGVIIGGAFNKVVDALVKEVFLPPLALLTEGNNWGSRRIVLRAASPSAEGEAAEEIAIGYGKLIEAGLDFLIIAIVVFAVVKLINAFRNRAEDPKDATVKTPKNIELLDRIADLLEEQTKLLSGGGKKP